MQGDLDMLEALRLDGSPDSEPIPAERLRTLTANQQRWRFAGDEGPTMTQMLQNIWDAAIALDTIRSPKGVRYYTTTGITRLKCSLTIREGLIIDPVNGFDGVRRKLWPRLDTG